MAFKARGLAAIRKLVGGVVVEEIPATPADNAGGFAVEVDGVKFTHRFTKYQGAPTPVMLAANNLDLRTLKGRPWPASATDRFTKSPPDSASRTSSNGSEVHLAGPSSMEMEQRRGLWPDAEEKRAQAIAEARFRDPEGTTRKIATAKGMPPEVVEALATRAATAGSMEHLAQVVAQDEPAKQPAATKPPSASGHQPQRGAA